MGDYFPKKIVSSPVSTSDLDTHDDTKYFLSYDDASNRFSPPVGDFKVYHKVFHDSNHTFVQYWFFSATSYLPTEGIPDTWYHEGDWETFQFTVRQQDSQAPNEKATWLEPFAVTAQQHYYAQTLKWESEQGDNAPSVQDQDYVKKDGFQPVVYIAKKSSAIYLREGEFNTSTNAPAHPQPQYGAPTGIGRDKTGSAKTIRVENDHLLNLEIETSINDWQGFWGAQNKPSTIVKPHGDAPPSPRYRGPAERGGAITVQDDPKGFHNTYLKSSQPQITIP